MSCALTSRRMRKDPRVYCSCNFLFKQDGLSSSQPAVLRGFVLHSEQIWIRLRKLTQSLLRCMNINVTSDWVEWQTGKYQFIMSFVLGQTISLWTYLMCFSPYEHDSSAYSLWNHPGENEVIFNKHCNQYTILAMTLKDDHTERDVTLRDFWVVNNESLH